MPIGNGNVILKSLFSLSGRINRTEFLFRYSIYALVTVLIWLPLYLLPEIIQVALGMILNIVLWILLFVLTVRRVHDYDEPAWYALLVVVPVVNLFVIFTPGIVAPNKYGDPPPPPSWQRQLLTAILLPLPFIVMIFTFSLVISD